MCSFALVFPSLPHFFSPKEQHYFDPCAFWMQTWSVSCLVLFYVFMSSLRTQVALWNGNAREEISAWTIVHGFQSLRFFLSDDLNAQTPKGTWMNSWASKKSKICANSTKKKRSCVSTLKTILLAVDGNNYEAFRLLQSMIYWVWALKLS